MAIATSNFPCCIFQNCFLAHSKMTQLVAAFTVLARPLHSSLGFTSPLTPFSSLLMAPPVLYLPSHYFLNSSHGSTSTAPPFSTLLMAPSVLHLPSRSLLNSSYGSTSIPPTFSLPSQLFWWLHQHYTSLLIPFLTLLTPSKTFSKLFNPSQPFLTNSTFLIIFFLLTKSSFSILFALCRSFRPLWSLCSWMLSVKMWN